MAEAFTPVEVFCSYASADEVWLRKLETHLSLLKQQGLLSLWHNRLILPGTDWAKEIDTHLETASVILLLVSADFFASDYCTGIEMKRALARQEAGEARVVPILVRSAYWKDAPFAHLLALPADGKPLSAWPDEDMAFTNVVTGIRLVLNDLPLLAASAPRAALPVFWNIPYQRNPFFLGRENELLGIRQNLQTDQTTAQRLAISGLGGIGKTQLALEYAYRYYQDYTAVLWARAESTDALISSYVELATLLRLPEREAKEQKVTVRAVKSWLQTHRDWLLILDNADDLTLLSDFLPHTLAGHLLLTTRAAATGRLAHRLEIETLPPNLGALFLLRRATLLAPDADLSQASYEEQERAMHISQELGGLPLALDQAGAYLEETGCGLADYQQVYQQHRDALLRKRGGLVADHPDPVTTTWSLSFQKVEEKNPAAADLLRVCAFLAPDAIPEEILTATASFLSIPLLGTVFAAPVAADPFEVNQTLEALRAYSLIRRNPTRKTLSIHRLVQVVLQDTLEPEEQRNWAERAVLKVSVVLPPGGHKMWPQWELLLPQALTAVQWIERYHLMHEGVAHLLFETAFYLRDRARFAEAEPLYQRLLHIREQQLGPGHYMVAYPLNNLAELYHQQGKYAEAEPLYRRALRVFEQQLGPEHPEVAHPLNNLANLYRDQGKYAEAESFYQRALSILDPLLGSDHPRVASSLSSLAELYHQQGEYAEAERLYRWALGVFVQQLGPEHPEVSSPLNGLANLSRDQGKYMDAERFYQRALHIREQALGVQHPGTAKTIHDLARLRETQGKYEEARSWYTRALAILEPALGKLHPKTMETRKRLIALLRTMEQYEQATQLERVQDEP